MHTDYIGALYEKSVAPWP